MSILFRCPCGRSMVVESDREGAVVTCPNCRRSLKVPSGKDRGVELASVPAATKTRTTRRCPRCGKDAPVDSQVCPHCKSSMTAAPAAAPATKPAAKPGPKGKGKSAIDLGEPGAIVYGGARGGWFSRLSGGAKAGVIGGSFAFVGLLALIGYFIYSSWHSGQIELARSTSTKALTDGRKLEANGKFNEAYELYFGVLINRQFLFDTGLQKDRVMVEALQARTNALEYVVPEPKVFGSVYWKPATQQEYDQAMIDLKNSYPTYRQWVLAVADAGLAAVQTGKEAKDQAAYEAKVVATMDAYMKLIAQSTPPQRAQFTFQTLISGLRELGSANRNWSKEKDRDAYLGNAFGYFTALKERVSKEGYPDALWER